MYINNTYGIYMYMYIYMVCVYKGWSLPVVVEMRPAVRNVKAIHVGMFTSCHIPQLLTLQPQQYTTTILGIVL